MPDRRRSVLGVSCLLLGLCLGPVFIGPLRGAPPTPSRPLVDPYLLLPDGVDRFQKLASDLGFSFDVVTAFTLDGASAVPRFAAASKALGELGVVLAIRDVLKDMATGRGDLATLKATQLALKEFLGTVAHGGLASAGIGIIDYALNRFGQAAETSLDAAYWRRYCALAFSRSSAQYLDILMKEGMEGLNASLDRIWQDDFFRAGSRGWASFFRRNVDAPVAFRERFLREHLFTRQLLPLFEHKVLEKRRESEKLLREAVARWRATPVTLAGSLVVDEHFPALVNGTMTARFCDETVAETKILDGLYKFRLTAGQLTDEAGSWKVLTFTARWEDRECASLHWNAEERPPRPSGKGLLVSLPKTKVHGLTARVTLVGAKLPATFTGTEAARAEKASLELPFGIYGAADSEGRVLEFIAIRAPETTVSFAEAKKIEPALVPPDETALTDGAEATEFDRARALEIAVSTAYRREMHRHVNVAQAASLEGDRLRDELDRTRDESRRAVLREKITETEARRRRASERARKLSDLAEERQRNLGARVEAAERRAEAARKREHERQVLRTDLRDTWFRLRGTTQALDYTTSYLGPRLRGMAQAGPRAVQAYEAQLKALPAATAAAVTAAETSIRTKLDRLAALGDPAEDERLLGKNRSAWSYDRRDRVDQQLRLVQTKSWITHDGPRSAKDFVERREKAIAAIMKPDARVLALLEALGKCLAEAPAIPDERAFAEAAAALDTSLAEALAEGKEASALAAARTKAAVAQRTFAPFLPARLLDEKGHFCRLVDLLERVKELDDLIGPAVPQATRRLFDARCRVEDVHLASHALRQSLEALLSVDALGTTDAARIAALRSRIAAARKASEGIAHASDGPSLQALVNAYALLRKVPRSLLRSEHERLEAAFIKAFGTPAFDGACRKNGWSYPRFSLLRITGSKGVQSLPVKTTVVEIARSALDEAGNAMLVGELNGAPAPLPPYRIVLGETPLFEFQHFMTNAITLAIRGKILLATGRAGLAFPLRGAFYELLARVPLLRVKD